MMHGSLSTGLQSEFIGTERLEQFNVIFQTNFDMVSSVEAAQKQS